jgi:nitrate reductase NapE component
MNFIAIALYTLLDIAFGGGTYFLDWLFGLVFWVELTQSAVRELV